MYAIELLSFGNGIYFVFIYLLNIIEVSKATVQVVDLAWWSYSKRYTFGH